MSDVILSLISGSIGGTAMSFIFQLFVNRNSFNSSRITAQVDEVVSDARHLEKIARDYWLLPGDDPDAESLSVEIASSMLRIGGLINILKYDGWIFGGHDIEQCIAELDEISTGGEFQVQSRQPNAERARKTSAAVTSLILALRQARRNAN